MSDDLEKELSRTPAKPMITPAQIDYLTDLLDVLDLTFDEAIRDCYVNGDFSSDPDDFDGIDDLSRVEASILIDYLKELRHEH
jgi:hypothetical protein